MRISGNARVNAPCQAIWKVIFNPGALLELIPGCDQVEQVASDEYRASLNMHLPALSGKYEILIKIVESVAPRFFRLAGSARGPGGGVQGSGTFMLEPQGQKTQIGYDSDFQINGPLAGMHPRFIEGVAQGLIREFLNRLADQARAQAELKT